MKLIRNLATKSRYAASRLLSRWYHCCYCDMPMPDCVCAFGRAKTNVANDNRRGTPMMNKIMTGLSFGFIFGIVVFI